MKIKDFVSTEDLKFLGIGWFKKVADLEISKLKDKQIIYVAQTPQYHDYGGYRRNTTRAYIWNAQERRIDELFYNLSNHRAKKAIESYQDYLDGKIEYWIWENYITNGYNTRRGLYADYSEKKERIKKIAKSHADYDLYATGDSKHDHEMRKMLRNN